MQRGDLIRTRTEPTNFLCPSLSAADPNQKSLKIAVQSELLKLRTLLKRASAQIVVQSFSTVVTLLGPQKIVTLTEYHNNK